MRYIVAGRNRRARFCDGALQSSLSMSAQVHVLFIETFYRGLLQTQGFFQLGLWTLFRTLSKHQDGSSVLDKELVKLVIFKQCSGEEIHYRSNINYRQFEYFTCCESNTISASRLQKG